MAENDAADVARAKAGDEGAFRALVERHGRAVFRLALRMTGNEQDAEDVVQEAFLKAYRRIGQFEDRAAFGSWLHRIAANCAYDLLRARARKREDAADGDASGADRLDGFAAETPSADRAVLSGQISRRLRAALARLSPQERAAFTLRHFEERPIREIGELLGLDEGAAKHSVFRAVRKLREALSPFVEARGTSR
ncbi:MAG: RNA polymerase sigma factor [Vicinamibacteria bacterium]